MRKTVAAISLGLMAMVIILFIAYKDSIFQKGNPFPYLIAAIKITASTPYIRVKENEVISKANDESSLISDFEKQMEVEFVEQAGSGFIFSDGEESYVISSEIYFGRFTVWTLPDVKGRRFETINTYN